MEANASVVSENKNSKSRNWTFLVYPESAPADWLERLKQRGMVGAISPLHDKDQLEDGSGPKKAHYHVMLVYPGPQTYKAVKALTDELNQPRPFTVLSLDGMYAYLTHKNNPEKYQYNPKEIETFGGFEIHDHVKLSRSELRQIRLAVRKYIIDHDVHEYWELLIKLTRDGLLDEEDYASNHTLELTNCLKSRRFMAGDEVTRDALIKMERQGDVDYVVDAQTGEIISEA